MTSFIDDHRDEYGVEPICAVLPIAPSTYYDRKAWEADPSRRSLRAQQDENLKVEVRRVWDANLSVYGTEKVWKQLNREGFTVARCTVERLMVRIPVQAVHPFRTNPSTDSGHSVRPFRQMSSTCRRPVESPVDEVGAG